MTTLRSRGTGYQWARRGHWLALALAISHSTSVLADNIDLSLALGVNPGELQLSWTGGMGPYQVHRSLQAAGVVSPANFIGEISASNFTDLSDPPDGVALFYVVVDGVCGDRIVDLNETCDDGNVSPGDGCSATCQIEVPTEVTTVDLSCTPPLWFSYQDGDGPWTQLDGVGGVFQFTLSSARGGFAYVRPIGSQFFTGIAFVTQTEARGTVYDLCTALTKSVSGVAEGIGSNSAANVSLGGGTGSASATQPSFTITQVQEGEHDLIGYLRSRVSGGNPDRAIIRRDQNIADGGSVGTIDFGGPESFTAATATVSLVGLGSTENVYHWMFYYSGTDCVSATLYFSNVAVTSAQPNSLVSGIPGNQQRSTDFHMLYVVGSTPAPSSGRVVQEFFHTLVDHTVTLPEALTSNTITPLGGTYKRLQADFILPVGYQLAAFNYYDAQHYVFIGATPGWVGGAAEVVLAMPDFAGLPAWNDAWAPATAGTGNWSVQLTGYDPPYPSFMVCQEGAKIFGASQQGTY